MNGLREIINKGAAKFYLYNSEAKPDVVLAYGDELPTRIHKHYKQLLSFFLLVLIMFCYTDIAVRGIPELVLTRIASIVLNIFLLVMVFTSLKHKKKLMIVVNNLYAMSLLFMCIGIIIITYDLPLFRQAIIALIVLTGTSYFCVKGFYSIVIVYTLPLITGVMLLFLMDEHNATKFQDLLNAFVFFFGIVAVSFSSERKRFKEFFYKSRLLIEKNNAEQLYIQTQDQNHKLQHLNTELDKILLDLTQSNNTKDKLFSLIAHDLRHPFNTLIGYSKLLVEQGEEFSNEDLVTFHQQMLHVSENTYKLLQNLLHWSMAQTNTLKLNPDKMNVRKILAEAMDEASILAQKKEQKIDLSVDDDCMVYVDREAFLVMLRNILSNAIKFSNIQSCICIRATYKEGDVEIKVCDTGLGMNQQTIDGLNGMMMVESAVGTQNEKGTGLGLLLCRDLVRKSAGTIHFESHKNKGTCVTLLLPSKA